MTATLPRGARFRSVPSREGLRRYDVGNVERAALTGLSARSARLANAARRRLRGEPLDARQREAADRTTAALSSLLRDLDDAEVFRSSLSMSLPDQAERFAFVRMARGRHATSETPSATPEEARLLASSIVGILRDIETVKEWKAPDPDAAQRIVHVFSRFSRATLPAPRYGAGERVTHAGA